MLTLISEHTLIDRINRVLKSKKRRLKKTTGVGQEILDLGSYYIIDTSYGCFIEPQVDIEDFGRYLNVLRDGEFYRP